MLRTTLRKNAAIYRKKTGVDLLTEVMYKTFVCDICFNPQSLSIH